MKQSKCGFVVAISTYLAAMPAKKWPATSVAPKN